MSDSGSGEKPNPEHQTTPEATSVQEMLAAMRDSGCRFAVVESSSHGLSSRTGRLSDVDFDVGILTNVTHEHLEFHGTWEQYRSDKANLFRNLDAHGHEKVIGGKARRCPFLRDRQLGRSERGLFRFLHEKARILLFRPRRPCFPSGPGHCFR